MVPDTTLRLRSVLKALDDIVTPALPQTATFAHEQLGLIKKSLELAIDQIPHEYAFMVKDARDHLELAARLSSHIPSGDPMRSRLVEASGNLDACLPAAGPNVPVFQKSLGVLKQALEDAADVLCRDREGEDLRAIEQLVLDHSARRITLERAWTIATGFEIDPSSVPPIAELLYPPASQLSPQTDETDP